MVAEILAINIRSNECIQRIKVDGKEFVISQLADDTTLFLNGTKSLVNALSLIEDFYSVSGLRLNKAKTKLFYLGNTNHRPVECLKHLTVTRSFRNLGIMFEMDMMKMSSYNLEEKFKNSKLYYTSGHNVI